MSVLAVLLASCLAALLPCCLAWLTSYIHGLAALLASCLAALLAFAALPALPALLHCFLAASLPYGHAAMD